MIRILDEALSALLTDVVALAVAVSVVRIVELVRRRHPISNHRFMAKYRAGHPPVCRTTSVEPLLLANLVVRRRTPAGAERVPPEPPAPAGPEVP